jgi:hypothetical protein
MRGVIAPLAVLALAPCARAASEPVCQPLPGAQLLWSTPGVRFVLVGEMHGTAETPPLFRDLVCAAESAQRPIVVGVERSVGEQPGIDAFLSVANRDNAGTGLLAQRGWHIFDGRSSRAMLALLEDLRALQRQGRIVEVVAFSDFRPEDSPAEGEKRMASVLIAAANRRPNGLVSALTGNVHASKKELASVATMAMALPSAETLSLLVIDKGGEAWNQSEDGCGPHKYRSTGGDRRCITLSEKAAPLPGFDGVASTGLAATASPPAVPGAPPPPACSALTSR